MAKPIIAISPPFAKGGLIEAIFITPILGREQKSPPFAKGGLIEAIFITPILGREQKSPPFAKGGLIEAQMKATFLVKA